MIFGKGTPFSLVQFPHPFPNHPNVSVGVGMEDDIVAVTSLLIDSF